MCRSVRVVAPVMQRVVQPPEGVAVIMLELAMPLLEMQPQVVPEVSLHPQTRPRLLCRRVVVT